MGTNQRNGSAPEWASREIDGFEVFSDDLERFSTEDLVFFLESSFWKSEYEKVAAILSSRENSLKAEIGRMRAAGGGVPDAKYKSLDAQAEEGCLKLEKKSEKGKGGLQRGIFEKLHEGRDRSASLEVKHRESEVQKLITCEELEKSKMNCVRLEKQLTRIKEELRVVQAREQRALERIDSLSAELEKKEKERREEFVELHAVSRDLERIKRQAEDERDEWKKKFAELQVRALLLVEENAGIIERQKLTEKKKKGNSQNDDKDDDEDGNNDDRIPIGKLIQRKESRWSA